MNHLLRSVLSLCLLLVLSTGLYAHTSSNSFIYLNETDQGWSGRMDLAIADLPASPSWDDDQDTWLNWGELQQRWPLIQADLAKNVTLTQPDQPCQWRWQVPKLTEHGDGAYVALDFNVLCQASGEAEFKYSALFASNPLHRALVTIKTAQGETRLAVLTHTKKALALQGGQFSGATVFGEFLWQGMLHLVTGYDHVLFLLTILLAAVFVRKQKQWLPRQSFKASLKHTLLIVSCFTLAHSVTLIPASLGWVALPAKFVETAIAISVLLAGLNLVFPVLNQYRYLIVCIFGLIHGFGFASVLAEMTQGSDNILLALLSFNLGIELAQVALVMLLLPLMFVLRQGANYRRLVLPGGGSLVAVFGAVWALQRVMG